MGRAQVPLTGLAIITALVSCGQPATTFEAPAAPPSVSTGRARPVDRHAGGACNPRQAADVTERISRRLVRQALARDDLKRLTTARDRERAERDMAQFLRWQYRGNAAVCRASLGEGRRALQSQHTEEAAAMLLGLLQVRDGSPVLVLPDWFQHHVRRRARGHGAEALKATLQDLGLSRRLASLIAGQLLKSGVYGERVAVRLPYREHLSGAFIRSAVQAKELQLSAGRSASGRESGSVVPIRPLAHAPSHPTIR